MGTEYITRDPCDTSLYSYQKRLKRILTTDSYKLILDFADLEDNQTLLREIKRLEKERAKLTQKVTTVSDAAFYRRHLAKERGLI